MKISELLNESQGVAEGREKFNTDLMKPGFRWGEEINGITYLVRTQWDNMPEVIARVNNREVGRATFIDHHTRSGLESVSTYVSPKWQGHGIAKNMYAVIRMLGANIQPSATQTDMGKDMWAKWKKGGDTKHLTSMNAKTDQQGVAESRENFNGIDISMEIQKDDEYVDDEDYDNQVLYVTASSKGKELGHVLFAFDGEYLMPQDLEVEERYRGQGIAQIMYDYVKSKGYKIRRSGQQTDAGAGFWDKHKPGKNVWEQGVAEGLTGLSIQQLATISDEALDNAYHYGRSQPGNTFGWQANLASAAYAKQMIDRGETDVEAISDAVHKGWWSVAQKFVDNPDQFDDTATLRAKGKFDKKMADRIAQMVPFNQLTKDQQDIDTVVARAMLQAIKGQQGVAEGKADYNFDIEDLKRLERIRDLPTLKTQAMALISKPSVKPMKPEKVEWFKNALDNQRMNSPMKVIKLMYDLLLSGEGNAVVGTRSSMNPNSYRQRFGEQGVAEDSWHGAGNDAKDAWHGAGDAWSGSGSDGGSAGGGIPVMGETTGKPLIRPVKYERADGSIEVTYELLAADGRTIKTGMSKEIAMSLLKHYRANHVSESIEQQRLAAMRRAGYFD